MVDSLLVVQAQDIKYMVGWLAALVIGHYKGPNCVLLATTLHAIATYVAQLCCERLFRLCASLVYLFVSPSVVFSCANFAIIKVCSYNGPRRRLPHAAGENHVDRGQLCDLVVLGERGCKCRIRV